jgi:oligopeptide/dipeptide ABC transporter ATP-binding protein
MDKTLVEVKRLKKYFPLKSGIFRRKKEWVHAVDDVDLAINKGETFGLVGESGCGKSTLGRTILFLHKPTEGEIRFEGTPLNEPTIKAVRSRMQIVFQDPFGSLNPRMTVGDIIGRPMEIHGIRPVEERRKRTAALLNEVGLNPDHTNRYPHEFSGGQRQRIAVARALSLNPSFIILDEPTSALDVSVQAQILNLFKDLQEKLGLTYLFISHNLNVINHVSDRIAVMYLGKIVEEAPTKALFLKQAHPYTQALFSAIPIPDPKLKREKIVLPGDIPNPTNPPSGCRFHPRCPVAIPKCSVEEPAWREISSRHWAACHLAN